MPIQVGHSRDHWRIGNPCPRYGFPGSERAIHDDPAAARAMIGAALRNARALLETQRQQREAEQRQREALEALELERRRAEEHRRFLAHPDYRFMIEEQSHLERLITWLRTQDPLRTRTVAIRDLLDALFDATEVHAAHLRLRPGEVLYHHRPEARNASLRIHTTIQTTGLSRIFEWHHITSLTGKYDISQVLNRLSH